ncbi:MAG: alcohol dehydrogenase [Deltaproteobacteria bacterium RBG_13_61_14]|nr:MAG: alcohol dehydrogenase [Deltaproteobacteria bacterium RBG_13_61_14]
MLVPSYYEFFCPVKILSGHQALKNLPYEMDQLGAKRALIVTDPGVVAAGLIQQVQAAFEGSDREIGAIFDQTPPDSSDKVARQVAELFKSKGCDCLVAVGGGSSIDTAKGANLMLTEGTDDLLKFQGAERTKKTMKPFIVVPTTAGTGSEVTMAAVITNTEKNIKMSITSYKILPNVAILDPKMTLTMPPKITAATGMDALTHAVEAYYCLQKNPVSDSLSITAIKLVLENLVKAVQNGKDEHVRLAMANAALLAGISFSNSLVGVVHSLAHATGGVCHVPHGVANAIFLPWGVEYNIGKRAEMIAELAPLFGAAPSGNAQKDASAVVSAIRDLNAKLKSLCGLPNTLRETGVTEDKLEAIAKTAVNDGTVAMNPEDVTVPDALGLLKKAF